jgi:hypothetical protein
MKKINGKKKDGKKSKVKGRLKRKIIKCCTKKNFLNLYMIKKLCLLHWG